MISMLVPRPGGMYDASIDEFGVPVPLFDDMHYLLDADSHSHREPCGVWCPRHEVIIVTITDDEGENP